MIRLFLLVILVAAPVARADDATIRVHVLARERPAAVSVQAEGGAIDLYVDGRLLLTVDPNGSVAIDGGRGQVTARTSSLVGTGGRVVLLPREGVRLRVTAGRLTRTYRGSLEAMLEAGALTLVNVVALDDYIASVVPSEYPFQEIEGVKAQAILVRTYALRSRGRFGSHDVVDHVGSQVYNGVASETPLARRAAELTRAEVLTYRGELIEAVYSSSSGGHTADNDAIWDGAPRPYLRGRPDPYDHASPLHRWSESVDRARLLGALSRAYGFQVTGFVVAGTSREGRVTSVRLLGARERIEQGNRFRLTLNEAFGRQVLKSTFFTVQREGERYVFSGRGFGHGVGMSQYGAREQARRGYSYRDILAFYFDGVTLERHASLDLPRPLAAELPPPERIEPMPPRPAHTARTRERTTRTGW